MMTNEQIVDDLTLLIELHEERVARGAVHGARDLAESVVTMLSAAGRLIPDEAEVTIEEQARIVYGDDGMVKGASEVASALDRALAKFGDRVAEWMPDATRSERAIAAAWFRAGAREVLAPEEIADALLVSGVVRPLPEVDTVAQVIRGVKDWPNGPWAKQREQARAVLALFTEGVDE